MKHGKYSLEKCSRNNQSVGSSDSWMYSHGDECGGLEKFKQVMKVKNKLLRSPSDSTLFSDYTNQVKLFDYGVKKNRFNFIPKIKCIKGLKYVSDKETSVSKGFKSCNSNIDKNFNDNIMFGSPITGCCTRLCDSQHLFSDGSKTTSHSTLYLKSSTQKSKNHSSILKSHSSKIYDKNKIMYSSLPNFGAYDTCDEKLSSSYSSLKKCHKKKSQDIYKSILSDYTSKMNKWNSTVSNHYSTLPNFSKTKEFENSAKFVNNCDTKSVYKSFFSKWCNNTDEKYPKMKWQSAENNIYVDPNMSPKTISTRKSYFTLEKSSSKKSNLHKNPTKSSSDCESEDAICNELRMLYNNYDEKLKEWTEAVSVFSDDSVIIFKQCS